MLLHEPESIEAAVEALASDEYGAKVIAGGTALVLMMQQGLIQPETLVSLDRIPGLNSVEFGARGVTIGARVTLQELADNASLQQMYPSLAYACHRVANIRIRNAATLGGNLAEADYASDPPSVLVALDASVDIAGPDGSRTSSVEDLLTGFYTTSLAPSEIITAISIPARDADRSRDIYMKYLSRSSEDRPCVGVAVNVLFSESDPRLVEHIRIVIGAAAATPQRFADIENMARGTDLGPEVIDRIAAGYAEAIDPIADLRGSAWYRKQMTRTFVRRALDYVRGTAPHANQEV